MRELYFISPLQLFFFSGLLMVLVLHGRTRSRLHGMLALTLMAIALWGLTIVGMRTSASVDDAIVWEKGALIAILAVPVFFYHFTYLFTQRTGERAVLIAGYTASVIAAAMVAFGLVVPDMQERWYGYAPRFGPLYVPYLLVAYSLTLLSIRNLVSYCRNPPSPAARNRTIYVLVGVGCALAGGVFDSLPQFISMYPLGMLGNLLFAFFTAIAILKHNLLDLRLAVEKGFVYSVVSAVILGAYVTILFSLNLLFQDNASAYSWPGSLAAVLTVAILLRPVLNRVQTVADRWFFRSRRDYLRALEIFSHETRDITNLRELAMVLEQSITLAMGAEGVRLLVPSSATNRFRSVTDQGSGGSPPFILGPHSPVITWLKSHDGVLSRDDIETEPVFLSLAGSERAQIQEFKTELIVPLRCAGELSGLLVLARKRSEEPYSDEDLSLLRSAANQTAMGLANARLFANVVSQRTRLEQLLERVIKAQEEERKRLSMELHDAPVQWLTSAVYRVEACIEYFNRGQQSRAHKEMLEVQHALDTTLDELRQTTAALHPPALDKVGLVKALARYTEAFERDTGISCHFESAGSVPRLPAQEELAIYRIVQETLSNVRKHALATQVHVRIECQAGRLAASVRDDGVGFEVDDRRRTEYGHLGLAGMEERARMLGGRLDVQSSPGAGTQITLILTDVEGSAVGEEGVMQAGTQDRRMSEVPV